MTDLLSKRQKLDRAGVVRDTEPVRTALKPYTSGRSKAGKTDMPKVTIYVTLKPTLLDAQGRTVESALHSLGFSETSGVRIGKIIELQVEGDAETVRTRAAAMCDQLLANPVTESYRIEVES